MKRMIDADAFFNDFPELKNYEHASQEYEVDAEPVKRGHWVNKGFEPLRCSVCGITGDAINGIPWAIKSFNYCPHCGAKMDGVQDETD